jgi:uncharacterized protein (UPF0248 family)
MIPIHELINRIRWDEAFAKGYFVIGYYDRKNKKITRTPFLQIYLTQGNHFFFQVTNPDGSPHEILFHRVKAVHKDGKLIWYREH